MHCCSNRVQALDSWHYITQVLNWGVQTPFRSITVQVPAAGPEAADVLLPVHIAVVCFRRWAL